MHPWTDLGKENVHLPNLVLFVLIFYLFQMSEDEGDSSPVDEDESDEVILTIISNSHF